MARIANVAKLAESDRISRGINVADAPAKALSKNYAIGKTRRGLPGIRNLKFSGALLDSRRVTTASDNTSEVAFTDAAQAAKANKNQKIEPMLGLSPGDRRSIQPIVAGEVAQAVRAMRFK